MFAPEPIGNGRSRIDAEIACAAETSVPALITTPDRETRNTIARTVHSRSRYRFGRFVMVNCAETHAPLAEMPLISAQPRSEEAQDTAPSSGGTIFLDEVGALSLAEQAFLKRFLETRDTASVASVRVIAGTSQPLLQRVLTKEFRDDLFYHLNIIHICTER